LSQIKKTGKKNKLFIFIIFIIGLYFRGRGSNIYFKKKIKGKKIHTWYLINCYLINCYLINCYLINCYLINCYLINCYLINCYLINWYLINWYLIICSLISLCSALKWAEQNKIICSRANIQGCFVFTLSLIVFIFPHNKV
jgi:uncharacterized protein YjbI with pentapeptide repeats